MCCHAYRPATDGAGQLDELVGVRQLTLTVVGLIRRVAAKGHQVLYTCFSVGNEDLCELESRVCHTDEVGHRGERGRTEHPGDEVEGALTRFAASPVGKGHERRGRRHEA